MSGGSRRLSIYLYSGTPGSGKSLHISERIQALNRLRVPIICNLQINLQYLKYPELYIYVDLYDLTPSFLIHEYIEYKKAGLIRKEGDIYLILDEAQRKFNCREYNNPDRRAWLDFFSIHRHFLFSCILCCQWDSMLDKQIRCLIEQEVKHRRFWSLGWIGKICEILAMRKLFFRIESYYGLHQVTGKEISLGGKRLYRLYNTHEIIIQDLPKKLLEDLEENCIDINLLEDKEKA